MTLEVAIQHRLGAFALDARFEADAGITALFGRSGSGKTTIVNMVAGLIRPELGRIAVAGEILFDAARRICVPAHRRRIGYVFQEGRLFPHLSVRQNLLYGRWFAPRAARTEHPDKVFDLLGITPLLDRRPGALSGGEKQRVAIGRALLASPRLLLMDEPLAALDDARKAEILPYLERLRDQTRIPIVYVSHAVAEVARLATTVVALADGRVEAVGPVGAILGRLDLVRLAGPDEAGEVLATRVAAHDEAFALTMLEASAGTLRVPRLDLPVGATLRVFVRARDVMLATRRPEGLSALNVLPGTIGEIGAGMGPSVEIRVDLGSDALLARLTRRAVQDLGLAPGQAVFAIVKSVTFDRASVGGAARSTLPPAVDA